MRKEDSLRKFWLNVLPTTRLTIPTSAFRDVVVGTITSSEKILERNEHTNFKIKGAVNSV
jgi:hypothetical protein